VSTGARADRLLERLLHAVKQALSQRTWGRPVLHERFTVTSGSEEISGHVKDNGKGDASCSNHILSFRFPDVSGNFGERFINRVV
jgi:hypothetical protein